MAKKKVKHATRRDLLNHSDEILDMFCESCFKDGIKDVPAVGFCVDCVTFFCKTCLKFHTKFLPDHVQKCHNEMPKDFCQGNCNTHKNEIVKYYCTKSDLLACSTCKINDHKGCESVQYVPTLLNEFEEKREYKSFDVMLQATEEKLQETKLGIEQGYNHAEQSKEETKSVINICKDNTAKLFDDLEREVKYKIDEISTENQKNLERSSKKLT
ncbi:E3 ubiquitin-protein ligase TRIM33-like [Mercenaria mercenaria]|uniref:E3 ubiquitin-protein ligase TRIM33-like n=1 Tax=Mercenaria mercenaria TaxID=6596 RepID=UPI00234F0EFD|nr:E3 ubiquitin-protein ligase TRIM33-like [Mercenaria mercenaria]